MFARKRLLIKLFASFILFALYYLISVYSLELDTINPDGINWHVRTQNFSKSLSKRDYGSTYQAYHPGVTLMWLSGPVLSTFKQDFAIQKIEKETFFERDYYAKLSVVIFGLVLFILSGFGLWKLVGFRYFVAFGVFMALEPFTLGVRRLYHLDFLLCMLLFLCFLFLVYYNYKSARWWLPALAGLFFALALLTKSSALIFLPMVPFLFLLGNFGARRKLLGFFVFLISTVLYIFVCFPPLWHNPIESAPKYLQKIAHGITDIGVEGKEEIGNSGADESVTLASQVDTSRGSDFYLASLVMRLSPIGLGYLVVALAAYIYIFLKGFMLKLIALFKTKKLTMSYTFSVEAWLAFWSLGFSVVAFLAFSISAKKIDRYEIIVFPFIFILIAYILTRVKTYFLVLVLMVYMICVIPELKFIHPYYIAYSSPLLGGITTRLYTLDDSPFGVGIYAAFQAAKSDLLASGNSGYYTISGTKSLKAISAGGKFSRFPSCVTDYVVVYALEDPPIYTCVQKYKLVTTVKIGGFDYWYIYKRLNQKHESNY